ncbi:MAG: hypothetical protein ACJ754_18460 [Pyrinomonadaceae bacterium]
MLGDGRRMRSQVTALAAAARDGDDGVRNNATRALVVLVLADPRIVRQVPPDNFIGMLLSGILVQNFNWLQDMGSVGSIFSTIW